MPNTVSNVVHMISTKSLYENIKETGFLIVMSKMKRRASSSRNNRRRLPANNINIKTNREQYAQFCIPDLQYHVKTVIKQTIS